jgi:hypothetical protein
MKPHALVGRVFNIPVFSAEMQQYIVKDVILWDKLPGHWDILLERLPSIYQVPTQIIIKLNRVVNGKMALTLNEINDKSQNQMRLNHIERKESQIATISGFRAALIDLSNI